MDEKYAEYFASGTRKIIRVEACSSYHLKLYFDNGEIKMFNVQPLIEKGNIFQYLQSVDRFNSVYLNDGVVCWDIDPAVDSNIESNRSFTRYMLCRKQTHTVRFIDDQTDFSAAGSIRRKKDNRTI